MSVPYTFATATSSIPLSQLDSNFATAITLGGTNLYLGNTTTTVTGLTLTGSTFTGNVTTSNAVITGGSIDGTTVGATTASTGAFTTLSASSTVSGTGFSTYLASPPAIGSTAANTGAFTTLSASSTTTLSGGTANGVAYLNGSKVLTTGSALVFDGSHFFANGLRISGADTANSIYQNTGALAVTTGAGTLYLGTNASNPITFNVNSSEIARFDTSGNLGLGVTPSASTIKTFNVGNSSSGIQGFSSGSFYTTVNAYWTSSGWTYGGTGRAFAFGLDSSSNNFQWNIAASGTAGNTISFTQAMTLDTSGRLGIGTTSPSVKLQVQDATSSNPEIRVLDGTVNSQWYAGSGGTCVFGTYSNHPLVFRTNGSEAARIDTSGNLLVGTTDNGGTNTQGLEVYIGSGATRLYIGHASGTANGTQYAVFNYAGTNQIGSISQSGTTAVLYNTSSDVRLKENIADAASASTLIDALQVRQFDWKSDGSHQRYGFVAQELVNVAPEAVHQPAGPEEMMAVDYSKLVPMLVKEIQSLRARLKAANIA